MCLPSSSSNIIWSEHTHFAEDFSVARIPTQGFNLNHLLIKKWVRKLGSTSVASATANFPNKIAKITGKFENVDKAKNQGVLCQH
jgi:hypothetical protein